MSELTEDYTTRLQPSSLTEIGRSDPEVSPRTRGWKLLMVLGQMVGGLLEVLGTEGEDLTRYHCFVESQTVVSVHPNTVKVLRPRCSSNTLS